MMEVNPSDRANLEQIGSSEWFSKSLPIQHLNQLEDFIR